MANALIDTERRGPNGEHNLFYLYKGLRHIYRRGKTKTPLAGSQAWATPVPQAWKVRAPRSTKGVDGAGLSAVEWRAWVEAVGEVVNSYDAPMPVGVGLNEKPHVLVHGHVDAEGPPEGPVVL